MNYFMERFNFILFAEPRDLFLKVFIILSLLLINFSFLYCIPSRILIIFVFCLLLFLFLFFLYMVKMMLMMNIICWFSIFRFNEFLF